MGLGFGALKEMNDSIRRNRELLKANKKNPFEKPDYTKSEKSGKLEDTIKASPEELAQMRDDAVRENRKDIIKRLIILGIVVIAIMTVAFAILLP